MISANHKQPNIFSAIILAGGNSSRMGFPKAWLKDNSENTFAYRIANVILNCSPSQLFIVLNKNFVTKTYQKELAVLKSLNCKIIINNYPEKGRLYSLYLALKQINTNNILIQNVDTPFVTLQTFEYMLQQSNNNVIVPKYNKKGGHPIIINKAVSDYIIKNYTNENLTLRDILPLFNPKYIQVNDENILVNFNTIDDLKQSF